MRKTLLLLLGMLFMWAGQVNAQWSVDAVETDYTIDFETTVSGVNEGAFDGSGFATTPATGQLDADAWAIYGMSDGDKDFGVENTTGDLARGTSTGGETTGGIYSFGVEFENNALGAQGAGTDFTPGWIGLKLQNNTGETVNNIAFSYDVWVYNDQDRSQTFNGEYSLDGTNWTAIPELAFATVEIGDAAPVWEKTTLSYTGEMGLDVNDGDFLYFRWYSDDNGGGGSRDEIAVDNITANLSYESGAVDVVRTADMIGQDPGTTGGTLNFNWTQASSNLDITQDAPNEVPWVEADGGFPPSSGNWVGVAIDFPAGFSESDIAGLIIDGNAYTPPILSAAEVSNSELWYYFDMNDGTKATESHTLIIDWSSAFNPETITINANNLELETNCAPIINFPFTESFEDATMPDCWTVLNEDGDSKEWDIYTSDANTGSQCVSVGYNGSGNNDWLISPQISVSSDNLYFVFAAKSGSSTYLEDYNVLLSTTGTATTDFTTVLENVTSAPNSWETKSYKLSDHGINSGDDIYVAIQCVSVDEMRLQIDDFQLLEITCSAPSDLALDANTADQATFSWTENGSATDWNLIYGAPGFDPLTEGTTVAADANPYTITGLTANYEYDVYVQSNCGAGDLSTMNGPVNFTTDCGVYTTPFSEDFSTYAPDCWSEAAGLLDDPVSFTSTTSSAWADDGFANDGTTGAAKVNVFGTARKDWLITPEIDLGDGSVTMQLEFDLALTAWNGTGAAGAAPDDKFAVIVSTDGGATWTSTNTLAIWDNEGSPYVYDNIATAGERIILDLTGYTGNVKFGFYAESTVSNGDNDLFIDNVDVRETPSCPAPTDLALDANTADQATFSWTENGSATDWNLIYGAPGFNPLTEGTTVAADAIPYTITGLSPDTEYDVYVQTNCGAGDLSTMAGPVNFTTDVWIELDLTGDDITITWNAPVGTLDPGIIINTAPYNTDGGFFLVQLYDESDNLVTFADVFEEFAIAGTNYSSGPSNRLLADFTATQQSGIWGTEAVSDNATAGGSLRGTTLDGSLFYGVMVDDPVGTVGAVLPGTGDETATMAYTIADDVYGTYTLKADFYVPFRPGAVGSAGFYTVAELEGLESLASISKEIDLGCAPVTSFPLTENFDGDWTDWCWTVIDNDGDGTTWEQDDTYITPLSGDWTAHGMDNSDDYLITPKLSLNSTNFIIEWYDIVENSTYNNTYDVLVSTTDTDPASFTDNLGTYDCTNDTWTVHTADLSAYDGQDIYIAFHQTYSAAGTWSSYGFGIDDVTVRELSSEADILTFELAEQTGAALIDAGAQTVEIEVGGATDVTSLTPTITVSDAASIAPESGVAQDFTNPVTYTVTAEDGTDKLWEVTVTPAATLSSENDILTFELAEQTEAATIGAGTVDIEVTWDTDVTSLVPTITVSPLATISPESGIAQDFTNPVTYTVTAEDDSEQVWTATVTKEPTPAGATCATAFDYGTINDPEVVTSIDPNGRELWYSFTITEAYADIQVSTCPSVYDTKVWVYDACGGNQLAYDDDAPGDFCAEDNNQSLAEIDILEAGTYYVLITPFASGTDISDPTTGLVITGSDCATPTDVAISDLTATGATITWTAGLNETAWNVKVSETSIDPTETQTGLIYDDVVNTTPELDLVTMLEELTDYYVYVQADCGADWTTEFMFTTPSSCPQPANLTANVGVDFAELDWDAFGGTEWNIKISDESIEPSTESGNIEEASATTTKPYTPTVTLDPNTTYYFYVQTSCGSDWSEEGMFTTECETFTSFPYEEGFENDWVGTPEAPTCWTVVNGVSGSYWEQSSTNANNGTYSAKTYNGSGSSYEADEWLISQAINLDGGSNLVLGFSGYSQTVPTGLNAELHIMLLDDVYDNTSDLHTNAIEIDVISLTNDWESYTIDLSAYSGVKYIAFNYYVTDNGYNYNWLYIDDVAVREISSETDFLTYSFPEQTGAADIDYTAYTIDVEVGNGTDLTALVADFTLSTGATADIAGTPQVSGVTANDFSSPVTYTVTAEDGATTQEWVVTVTEAAINDETDILTYSFPEATSAATIDATENTVDIEVAWNADVTALVADFTLSYGATAAIAGTDQESGVTENDFTDPVVYTVTAEDGTTTEDWTVTVTLGDVPMGANCDNPFMVNLPSELPYTHADQTNCGLGNFYEETDMDFYDNGEDAIYEITVTSDVFVNITLDPGTTNYSGIGLFEGCPDSNVLIDDALAGFSNDPISLTGVALTAGTYYIMIDTWSTPDCIDNYTLTITTDPIADYVNNTTLTLTPETQNVATGDNANGVLDVVYPTTVSDAMPVDMMTDAMIDLSELTAGAVVELLDDGTSLGTYTVTGSESVWASEAFTGVNRVPADMTEGQSLSWDVVISDLDDGTYNVSATLYLGLDADLTDETDITEVATDAMEIIVAAPFIDLALLMPDGNAFVCDFTDPQNVPVEIENVGNTTIASGETINFVLDVNGSNEITEDLTLSEDLLPGETYETMTTNTIDFSALGTYEWEATILYTGDADMNNNFTTGYTVHFNQEIEFVDAVNDTITIASTDWPYTIETDLTLTTDSVLVSTYEWELDGSTETSLTVNDDGWYTLHVTTEYCTTTDSVYVLAFNNIEGVTADKFSVYPNPNNGQFMIEMNLVEKQDVLLSIFNSNGQLVREFKFDDIDSFARQIDMNNVAEGLYLIRINAGGNMFNSQVVIR